MKFFLCVLGMVLIVEGLPWFAFPDKMKKALTVIFAQSKNQLRVMGATLMLAGCVLLFWGKN